MAQFSHADFGGMSQWSPGMSMVGDMFNSQLKSKLDALCTDIAAHLDASEAVSGAVTSKPDEVSYRSEAASPGWWPMATWATRPRWVDRTTSDTQSSPKPVGWLSRDWGTIFTYDTGNHQIFGVSQTQSSDRTLSFTSQSGLVKVTDLTKV